MTKQIMCALVFLCILIVPSVNAATVEKPVAPQGRTVIDAISAGRNVRVTIKTHKVSFETKGKRNDYFMPTSCIYASSCSIVNSINIAVNGNKLFVPGSILADLSELSTAEIRFDGENNLLILEEGDGSKHCLVKIEFDQRRINRMSLYADESMTKDVLLQETVYHGVIW